MFIEFSVFHSFLGLFLYSFICRYDKQGDKRHRIIFSITQKVSDKYTKKIFSGYLSLFPFKFHLLMNVTGFKILIEQCICCQLLRFLLNAYKTNIAGVFLSFKNILYHHKCLITICLYCLYDSLVVLNELSTSICNLNSYIIFLSLIGIFNCILISKTCVY